MKTVLIAAAAAAAAFLACASGARAGGPYVVDDAGTAPAGRCQIETWVTRGHDPGWVVAPACAVGGARPVELTLGLRGQDGATWLGPAAKRGLADFGDGRLTLAASFAAEVPTDGGPAVVAVNLPLTIQAADAVLLHLNLGWSQEGDVGRATWGLNAEHRLAPRLWAVAETHGDDRGGRGWQAGLRYALAPDRLDLDLTVGRPDRADDGLTWTLALAAAF